MMLIDPKHLKQALLQENIPAFSKRQLDIIATWIRTLKTNNYNEEHLQSDFLNAIFGGVLGYTTDRKLEGWNIEKEKKTDLDGQKPDGVLGFFEDHKRDIRVIIELKAPKINLDKKQNQQDNRRTPVEQAFGYVPKFQGIEFVIVSNFNEIRLYKSNYQGKYQRFMLEDLASNAEQQREFWALLAKDRLFTKTPFQSFVHALDDADAGEKIEKTFYKHYKDLREVIWEDLIHLNKDKNFGKNFYLYKAQKLIDRIVFIRFCRENGALNHDVVQEVLNNTYVQGQYNRLKLLFQAMNNGNPEIGIAKFNGGLFADDPALDSLNISDAIIDKIKILYDRDFGSDLSVNILGHIFEQSITDFEHLTGDTEQKRKKDGIYYTPDTITNYIVKEAVGGWLLDRKRELGINTLSADVDHQDAGHQDTGHDNAWHAYAKVLKSIKVCDPACGSGAFLVKVFDYLQQEWKLVHDHIHTDYTYQDILTHNIFGVDINVASVGITKLSLWLKTATHKQPLTSLDDNIKVGNSLIDNPDVAGYYHEFEGKVVQEVIELSLLTEKKLKDIETKGLKKSLAFNWHKEFPQVFGVDGTHGVKHGDGDTHDDTNSGFDVIVGNPPYVRQEKFSDIKPSLKGKYKVYTGVADLYCYFYERAYKILQSNGYLGFITSNKWMRAHYGEALRQFLLTNTIIKSLVDFEGKQIFDQAAVDTSVIIWKKEKQNSYVLNVSSDLQTFRSYQSMFLSKDIFSIHKNSEQQKLKEKIESMGTPLKNWDVEIEYGIKTGYNKAFIIDTKTKDKLCKEDPDSAKIIKPLLRGRDIHRYYADWAGLWLIFTRQGVDIEKYKAVKKYLFQFYDDLKPRNNNESQGRKPGTYKWYEIQDNVAYYQDFEKEKIIYSEIVQNARFSYDNHLYVEATSFFITGRNLKYLLAMLNSKFITDCFRKFYSGTGLGSTGYRYKKFFFEQLPIPQISPKKQQPFIKAVQAMLDYNKDLQDRSRHFYDMVQAKLGVTKITKKLKTWYNLSVQDFIIEVEKQNKNLTSSKQSDFLQYFEKSKAKAQTILAKIHACDAKIDAMVYDLYGLTNDDISIIAPKGVAPKDVSPKG